MGTLIVEKDKSSMLDILHDMSILSDRDVALLDQTFPAKDMPDQREQFIASILLDTEAVDHQELRQANLFLEGLSSDSLLVQTRTRISIAKFAVSRIAKKIEKNIALSDKILRSIEQVKKKSSSEYLSLNSILDLSKK